MLNTYLNLEYFEAKSAAELQQFIKAIPTQVEIISIYGMNGRHFVWFRTNSKIKRVKKDGITDAA